MLKPFLCLKNYFQPLCLWLLWKSCLVSVLNFSFIQIHSPLFTQTKSSRLHVTFSIFSPPRKILAMIYEGSIKREFSLAWLCGELSEQTANSLKRAKFCDGVRAFRSVREQRYSSRERKFAILSMYRSIIYAYIGHCEKFLEELS